MPLAIWSLICGPASVVAAEEPFVASQPAIALDSQIDWSRGSLIVVQDDGRYKTLDSFARESMAAMFGQEHLPGLTPMASLMEWLFNRPAYEDAPVVRIKDRGVRIHLSVHLPEAARQRVQQTGYLTPRELSDPRVAQRITELEPLAPMVTAMRRVRNAQAVAEFLPQFVRIIPGPDGNAEAPWYTIDDLQANLPPEIRAGSGQMPFGRATTMGPPIPKLSERQALSVFGAWAGLWKGWTQQDAARVQQNLDRLAEILPTLAATGVYPSESGRRAEAVYYKWGKFTWGYWVYVLGMILAVPALVGRRRGLHRISLGLLIVAMGIHACGIILRWYILGRIPVANMFEALTASAWVGIAIALLVELRYRTHALPLAAHATGFLALLLAGHVVPGGGTLTTIMGILDDVMLRIHTVLIISSYALIFVAGVIALVYLFGYYYTRCAAASAEVGGLIFVCGFVLWLAAGFAFQPDARALDGIIKSETIGRGAGYAAAAAVMLLVMIARSSTSHRLIASVAGLALACGTLALGNQGFCVAMAYVMAGSGLAWAAGNAVGLAGRLGSRSRLPGGTFAHASSASLQGASHGPSWMLVVALDAGPASECGAKGPARQAGPTPSIWRKPIAAGGMPGDSAASDLPEWLRQLDWSHLIILNLVFVMLFVGVILGAVWADYSWGRPWGWDPKEVFALNTWIIYAILIHLRFVTTRKGLWTAWCSVAGCLMMAFNWCIVNFYIVGLHSYA